MLLWRFLYPLLYFLAVLLYWPWQRTRGRGKSPAPLLERAGRLPAALAGSPVPDERRLWIHAVSVGEVNVVKPLVDRLDLPAARLALSTVTTTGQQLARQLYAERATVFYFPLDFRFSCRRYLSAVQPAVVALTETELWPGFILEARRQGVRLALVNGRLSDRSFRRYRRVRGLLRPLLQSFEKFCMQSRQDKERILELGAPPEKVHLMGNLKYDYRLAEDEEKQELAARIGELLRPAPGGLVWVCGSTREGEEALLLPVFARLRQRFPELRLLVAPRHPHRGPEVAELVRGEGWKCLQRSGWNGEAVGRPDVLVLDSIGELAYLYEIADVVFVGGSLVDWGGHNVIEAAHFSRPILFGPHMQNFREIAARFLEDYAALQVENSEELADRLTGLLEDAAARKWLGRNARKVVRDNQGAVERTAEVIRELLDAP